MKQETEILTRCILFEKGPFRIRIYSNKEYEQQDAAWYIQHSGFVFECERELGRALWRDGPGFYLVKKNITTGEIFKKGRKFYINPHHCKILSGY